MYFISELELRQAKGYIDKAVIVMVYFRARVEAGQGVH